MTGEEAVRWATWIALIALFGTMLLAMIRAVRGPTLPDRALTLDFLSFVVVGIIATYGIHTGTYILIDAATVIALITFVATIGFARFIEDRGGS